MRLDPFYDRAPFAQTPETPAPDIPLGAVYHLEPFVEKTKPHVPWYLERFHAWRMSHRSRPGPSTSSTYRAD